MCFSLLTCPGLCCVYVWLGKPSTGPSTPNVSPEQTGRIIALNLLIMLFLMYSRRLLAFCAKKAYFWLVVNFLFTGTPAPFLPSFLSAPSIYWCLGLFLPKCRTCHLPLLNFTMFLTKHFSYLLRSL